MSDEGRRIVPAAIGIHAPANRYTWAALAAAAVLGVGVGHDLLHMPLQVYDSFTLLLDAVRSPSAWYEFRAHLSDDGFFRPGYYATIKIVADLSQGHYFLAYRLYHALLMFAFVILFVRALEVHDGFTLAVAPLALTVFLGIHTFLGTVREIWPISHFLQVAVLSLAALNLTQSRGGVRVDLALLATFAAAALTLESGVVVWVIIVVAWLSGMPGASRRSVILVSGYLAFHLWLWFVLSSSGVASAGERSTGFLFERLDPDQIRERFGGNVLPLYAYNVVTSMISVLFSEPRAGTWVITRALVQDSLRPRDLVHIGSSLFATGLIVAYVIHRVRSGIRWPVTLSDRHVVIFAAVLAANAVVSFAYTKDEIITIAGALYGLPVYGAAVYFLRRWPERPRSWPVTTAMAVLFLVGSTAWATRAVGVHNVMRNQAFIHRNDWTRIERDWRRDGTWEQYKDSAALIRRIRDESISMRVVTPEFVPRWMDRVFDTN